MLDMSVHSRIKDFRETRGLTHQQFADAVGVSRGAVQQWEKGSTAPTRKHQPAVAKFMGLSVDALMSIEADANITIPSPTLSASGTVSNQPLAPVERAGAAIERRVNVTSICPIDRALTAIAALLQALPADDRTTVEGLITSIVRKPEIASHVIGAITAIVDGAKKGETQQAAKHQPPVYRTGTHD